MTVNNVKPPRMPERLTAFLGGAAFEQLLERLQGFGISAQFVDMKRFYQEMQDQPELRRLNFTALSDGKSIFLNRAENSQHQRSVWAWDCLHLFGHMFQWHATPEILEHIGLSVGGERAIELADRDFMRADDDVLAEMQIYEIEANSIGFALFQDLVNQAAPNDAEELTDQYRQFVIDDLIFLTRFYLQEAATEKEHFLDREVLMGRLISVHSGDWSKAPSFKKLPKFCIPVLH